MNEDESADARLSPETLGLELRHLALVDRVLGLEAEVARLSAATPHTSAREEIEKMHVRLRAAYDSSTWRVGTAVLRPLVALRALRRR